MKRNFGPISKLLRHDLFWLILSFKHFENDQSVIYLNDEKNKTEMAFSPIGWAVQ